MYMVESLPPRTASAGLLTYLVEELGDARLRCAQLKSQIEEARSIVESSPSKEQVFEVAGHLIQSIPDALFRLDKALSAVALAATRMDYEELKQDVKPEKVQELDQVYDDIRLRYLQRRSEVVSTEKIMTPKEVSAKISALVQERQQTGTFPLTKLAALAEYLGAGSVDSWRLERLASTLLQQEAPSREEIASELVSCLVPGIATDQSKKTAGLIFERGSHRWMLSNRPGKDAQTGERILKGQIILWDASWKRAYSGENAVEKAQAAGLSPLRDSPETRRQVQAYQDERAGGRSYNPRKQQRGGDPYWTDDNTTLVFPATGTQLRGQAAKDAWLKFQTQIADEDTFNYDAGTGRYAGDNSDLEVLSTDIDARYERGEPADPTENMSEEDAETWQEMNDKYEDQFKKEADSQWVKAMRTAFDEGLNGAGGDEQNVSFALNGLVTSAEALARTAGRKISMLGPPIGLFSKIAESSVELAYAVGSTISAHEDQSKYAMRNVQSSLLAEDKESRFEEGEPTDPTENMSEEDRNEWWKQHAKNKDRFKESASVGTMAQAREIFLRLLKDLPFGETHNLNDYTRRFHGIHYKVLMAALKQLDREGFVKFDGFNYFEKLQNPIINEVTKEAAHTTYLVG